MKKLVQDLVKHPYGQLCQLQQGEKNKDVPASSIRTPPAIQTAFASSEGNGSGELLKSYLKDANIKSARNTTQK